MLYLALNAIKQVAWAPPTQVRAQVMQTERKIQQVQALNSVPNPQINELKALAMSGMQRLTSQMNDLAKRAGSTSDLDAVRAFANSQFTTLSNRVKQLSSFLDSCAVKSDQALNNAVALSSNLTRHSNEQQALIANLTTELNRQGQALSGNIKLYEAVGEEEISAALLNAAAAGTFEKELLVSLVSEVIDGETTHQFVHPWALFPVVQSAEVVADEDIVAPTVEMWDDDEATLAFANGVLHMRVIFDTDAGVTKTYAAEDEVTVTVKTASDSKLLGWPIADLVKTYTVVA